MEYLKEILIQKGKDFSSHQKNTCGYDYLLHLIEKIHQLKFKNYSEFHHRLHLIVEKFPVANAGYINYRSYLFDFQKFRKYIKQEFGLYFGYEKMYFYLFLGLILGGILGFFAHWVWGFFLFTFISVLGFFHQKKLRKKGRILGLKKN